jgi:hypothetical protein
VKCLISKKNHFYVQFIGKKPKNQKKIPDLAAAAARKFLKFSSPRRRLLYFFEENRRRRRRRLCRSAYTSNRI